MPALASNLGSTGLVETGRVLPPASPAAEREELLSADNNSGESVVPGGGSAVGPAEGPLSVEGMLSADNKSEEPARAKASGRRSTHVHSLY
jgi:hypothetical protein